MFRGSVIDSEYKGLSTIEIMNALAPDIVTIGNHEVDYGVAHLLFIEKLARFPIINANLYIKHTQTRLFTPYKILQIDGMNILFIGIITQDVINQTKSESLIGSFVDTAAAAVEVGKICNAHNSIDIDFTVLLTHIGFEEDRRLASQLDPAWGVDLIIGGHSHTFLEQAWEENGIVITQAGTGTDQIGRFDIVVDTDNNCIDSYTWKSVPIIDKNCPRNPVMEQVIAQFSCQVDEKYNHIVARFRRELTHPERNQETELGDLLADIFTQSLGVDVMLLGSGSIRAERLGPVVTYRNLTEAFPYDDGVYLFKVTGRQLRHMLRFMLREESFAGHTEFYQIPAALRLRYSRSNHDFESLTYKGEKVTDERISTSKTSPASSMSLGGKSPACKSPVPLNLLSGCAYRILSGVRVAGSLAGWPDHRNTITGKGGSYETILTEAVENGISRFAAGNNTCDAGVHQNAQSIFSSHH